MKHFKDCGIDWTATQSAPFHRPLTEDEISQYVLRVGFTRGAA